MRATLAGQICEIYDIFIYICVYRKCRCLLFSTQIILLYDEIFGQYPLGWQGSCLRPWVFPWIWSHCQSWRSWGPLDPTRAIPRWSMLATPAWDVVKWMKHGEKDRESMRINSKTASMRDKHIMKRLFEPWDFGVAHVTNKPIQWKKQLWIDIV